MSDLIWNYARLEQLVNDKEQERFNLEFKPCDELRWGQGTFDREGQPKKREDVIDELSRDISAMANSAGGVIIFGIEESHKTSTAKRLDVKVFTADEKGVRGPEWLDTVIRFNISPPPSVRITPVFQNDDKQMGWYYVVEVQQGVTSHQANDKKFYERLNTTRAVMEQYRIVDVMNRAKGPVLESRLRYEYVGTERVDYDRGAGIHSLYYDVLNVSIEITTLNYISAEYGSFRIYCLFPLAVINGTDAGALVGNYPDQARASVFLHNWSVHQGEGVYPGVWTNLGVSCSVYIPQSTVVSNPMLLLKTEVNGPNMPIQTVWYQATPVPETGKFWSIKRTELMTDEVVKQFWQTYHMAYELYKTLPSNPMSLL